MQEYIDRTGLDPYVPESQAREEKAERDRRKKGNCGDEEEFKGGEEEEVYKEAAGSLKEEHDGLAPWEAADSEKGWDKKAAGSENETSEEELARASRILRSVGAHSDFCNQHSDHGGDCTFDRRKSSLSPQDRRYVTLESSRFLADNIDTNDARELGTRAMHYAQKATSSYSVDRSRTITTAFVQRVVDGATQRSNHIALLRSASRPALDRAASLPSEALFL